MNKTEAKSAVAYFCRQGDECFKEREYVIAIEKYTKAIDLDPENAIHYRNRGDAYFKDEEYEAAIADFTEAIRLKSDDAIAYSNRGNAYRELGDETKALNDEQMTQALTHTN
jgi:tetratricopeptide (TPR) repeat protein